MNTTRNKNARKSSKSNPRKKRRDPGYTAHITLVGQGVSDTGERFIKLQIAMPDGSVMETVERIDHLSKRDATSTMFRRLNQSGAHLITAPAQRKLLERIQDLGPQKPSFRVVTKVGWAGEVFVRPDGVIGTPTEPLEVYLGAIKSELLSKYRVSGTRKSWKEIPKLARGNSRMMLSLSQALVGPLGDVLGVEQVGLQLCGEQGSGKTAVAIAAGSVWGLHRQPERGVNHGFGETWKHTINNLDNVAAAHNHTVLILDETRVAATERAKSRATVITDAAFSLSAGVEKGRLTDVDEQGSWWVPILSTSNLSLDEMATEDRIAIDDAHRGRLIDVSLPEHGSGIFENLHGFPTTANLAKHLIDLAHEHHGAASVTFLKRLVAWRCRDEVALQTWLEARRTYYLKRAMALQSQGRDLNRIHQKFATDYAAGCLGIKFGLFPWTRVELRDALLACERAHVAHVEQFLASVAPSDPLEALRAYLREHRDEVIDLRESLLDPNDNLSAYPGFLHQHQGKLEFLFLEPLFEKIAGGTAPARRLKKDLVQKGYLWVTAAGDQGPRYVVKRRLVENGHRQTVIAIAADILGL